MRLDELLPLLGERGLSVEVNEQGDPKLIGDSADVTPLLRKALARRRAEIIDHFLSKIRAKVECLWPGTGYIGPHWFTERWPAGAYFWRQTGTEDWQPIPGRAWDEATKRGKVL